jgi:hypothetical protein
VRQLGLIGISPGMQIWFEESNRDSGALVGCAILGFQQVCASRAFFYLVDQVRW